MLNPERSLEGTVNVTLPADLFALSMMSGVPLSSSMKRIAPDFSSFDEEMLRVTVLHGNRHGPWRHERIGIVDRVLVEHGSIVDSSEALNQPHRLS